MEEFVNSLQIYEQKPHIQESDTHIIRQSEEINNKVYSQYEDEQSRKHIQNNQNIVQDFLQYVEKLDQKLIKANSNQLNQLKNKYRFYLSKVDKLQQIKNSLQERFDSMHQLVQNSSAIQQQKSSILWFTTMINQTSKKLQHTQSNVNKAKEEKKLYNKKIQSLKQLIKKEKDIFFILKRTQVKIKNQKQVSEKASKLQSANSTFKTIVNNKLNKKNQKSQRLLQISSRLSNCELLNLNKQNNSSSKEQQPALINKLPYLTNIHQNVNNAFHTLSNHSKRQSFNTQQIMNPKNENELRQQNKMRQISKEKKGKRQYMYLSTAFQDYKLNCQQNKIKNKFFKTNTKAGNEVFENNNKTFIIKQLDRINLLKHQLIKQAQKLQTNPLIKKRSSKNKQALYQRQDKKIMCKQKSKQCRACLKNVQRHKLSITKYSLHQQQILNIISLPEYPTTNGNKNTQYLKKNIMKEDNDKDLLASDEELKRRKEYQKQKQQFLARQAEDIIKMIVQKDKIHEVLKLLERYKFMNTQAIKQSLT